MTEDLLTLTSDIVAAHVSHNKIGTAELPGLIRSTFEALQGLGQPARVVDVAPVPAVSIRASVKPDYLVCLEDGQKLKMLKRYLHTNFGMTPQEYRAKWGLPHDYPMVAPNYAEKRRALAHSIGLGQKRSGEAAPKPVKAAATPAPRADRKKLGIAAAKAAAASHLDGAAQKAD